ncbi:hypothetical protein ACFC8N_11430 [Streptomyces sp. NPDC055966]|uniref:SCO2400 family protein n=1 Tax=Streptomyces sp. NPDC055966 TaxID=3345669 RepID=UPI0035DC4FF1
MDYCSSCRRHLNGALVCPGCGAYAPDIAPPGTDGYSGANATGTASPHIPSTTPAPAPALDDIAWYDGVPAADPAEYGAEAAAGAADVTDAPRAPQGRAARRRQLARWKKSQRRAVVATAVALVGGGLAFSSMDRGSGDRAQAATAPDNRSMGLGEEQPASPGQPPATPTPSAPRHAAPSTSGTPTGSTDRTPAGYSYVPQQQSHTSTPHTARSATRPDSVPTTPRPTGTSTPSTGTSTNSSTGTGSSTASTPPPAPGTSTSSGSSSSPSSPSSSSSSNQLCLVVICLGGS